MKDQYSLTNPAPYKTYNPNWEPWVTEEEYESYVPDACNCDDDDVDNVKVTT